MSPPKSGSASKDATNRASTQLQTSLSKGKGTATGSGSEESVTENKSDPVADQTPIRPESDVVTLMRKLALLRAELVTTQVVTGPKRFQSASKAYGSARQIMWIQNSITPIGLVRKDKENLSYYLHCKVLLYTKE